MCDIQVCQGTWMFWMGSVHVCAVNSVQWKPIRLQSCVGPHKLIFSILSLQVQLWGLPGHSWLASVPDCSASSGGHCVRFGFGWAGWRLEGPGGFQLQGHPQLPPKHRCGLLYNLRYCVGYLVKKNITESLFLSLLQCTVTQDGWCLALWRADLVSACRDGFISMRDILSKRYEHPIIHTFWFVRVQNM